MDYLEEEMIGKILAEMNEKEIEEREEIEDPRFLRLPLFPRFLTQ